MIACFFSNISAKYYKNPSMLCRVIAKNVRDVFLRHSVDQQLCSHKCKSFRYDTAEGKNHDNVKQTMKYERKEK